MRAVEIAVGILAIAVLGLAGYAMLTVIPDRAVGTSPVDQPVTSEARRGYGYGGGGPPSEVSDQPLATVPSGELSEEEREGILYMREEEKLARDVYLYLYDRWGLQIFQNIARSEQRHMDMVKVLIDRYGLEDPAKERGVFTNPELQALYDELIERGNHSPEEALKVGALIEEVDIKDLKEWLSKADNVDIIQVYENLMRGSRNHLRAFTSVLRQYGVTYQPQILSMEEYTSIISGEMETGMGKGPGRGRGGRA